MRNIVHDLSLCLTPEGRRAFAMADTEEHRTTVDAAGSAAPGTIELPGCVARRKLLVAVLAAGVAGVVNEAVRAQEDAPGADERPQKADLLVFAQGERAGEVIKPDDLPLGGPPAHAWPMDPNTRVVRSGSRLNELLVVRLDPAELDDETRSRAADGIVAYSAICSHAGCPVTAWVKAFDGNKEVFKCVCHNSEYDPRQSAQVVFGPAPRRLAALPLMTVDRSIAVTARFVGKVGAQQGG
jgi:rieske iron-sulfur protein